MFTPSIYLPLSTPSLPPIHPPLHPLSTHSTPLHLFSIPIYTLLFLYPSLPLSLSQPLLYPLHPLYFSNPLYPSPPPLNPSPPPLYPHPFTGRHITAVHLSSERLRGNRPSATKRWRHRRPQR